MLQRFQRRLSGVFRILGLLAIFLCPAEVLAVDDLPHCIAEVSWLKEGDKNTWPQAEAQPSALPLYRRDGSEAAKVFLAYDEIAFYLHVVVDDPLHWGPLADGELWDADSLQIAIDPQASAGRDGVTIGDRMAEGGVFMTVSLAKDGNAYGVIHKAEPAVTFKGSHHQLSIVRDEQKQKTIYHVALAWQDLHRLPYESSRLGLYLQLNARGAEGTLAETLFLGQNERAAYTPELFAAICLSAPQEALLGARLLQDAVLDRGEHPGLLIMSNQANALRLVFKFGSDGWQQKNLEVQQAQSQETMAQWQIPLTLPRKKAQYHALRWQIWDSNTGLLLKQGQQSIVAFDVKRQLILQQLENKLSVQKKPLSRLYLQSLLLTFNFVQSERLTQWPQRAYQLQPLINDWQKIIRSLPDPEKLEQEIAQGQKPYIFYVQSSYDRTLQPYALLLPKLYDANKKYPLTVCLHGKGDPDIASFLRSQYKDLLRQDPNEIPSSLANEETFVLMPWARGNLYYKTPAIVDIEDALRDVQRRFAVDEQRIYLMGFSMGGFGALATALRLPNTFAAIRVHAAALKDELLLTDIWQNIQHLPIFLSHGAQDGTLAVSHAYQVSQILQQQHIKHELKILLDLGHTFPLSLQKEGIAWLLKHEKHHATSFTYQIFDSWFSGRSGISFDNLSWLSKPLKLQVEQQGHVLKLNGLEQESLHFHFDPQKWFAEDPQNKTKNFAEKLEIYWNGKKIFDDYPRKFIWEKEISVVGP